MSIVQMKLCFRRQGNQVEQFKIVHFFLILSMIPLEVVSLQVYMDRIIWLYQTRYSFSALATFFLTCALETQGGPDGNSRPQEASFKERYIPDSFLVPSHNSCLHATLFWLFHFEHIAHFHSYSCLALCSTNVFILVDIYASLWQLKICNRQVTQTRARLNCALSDRSCSLLVCHLLLRSPSEPFRRAEALSFGFCLFSYFSPYACSRRY